VEPLPDGTYDVMIVDVETGDDGRVHVDIVLTTGTRKGEVLSLQTSALRQDPLTLMGLPATLRVSDGLPALETG
jgi:hypothetical protein